MRKIAIMQPYFFPYIGYFSLMEYADEFILFDTAQYDRKGWMNRNRILKPDQGWQYIRAGVMKPEFQTLIKDVTIDPNEEWRRVIIRQLEHYRKTAPYYKETIALVQNTLALPAETLTQFNRNGLEIVRDYLSITCPIYVYSEMKLAIGKVIHPGQWALRISQTLGADEYVNPPGGRDIFDPSEFLDANIRLSFLTHRLPQYDQRRQGFEEGLSIIDVLMFNPVSAVRQLLSEYDLASY